MDGWPISSRIIGKNLKNLPPPKKKTKNRICIQQEVHQTAAENPKKNRDNTFSVNFANQDCHEFRCPLWREGLKARTLQKQPRSTKYNQWIGSCFPTICKVSTVYSFTLWSTCMYIYIHIYPGGINKYLYIHMYTTHHTSIPFKKEIVRCHHFPNFLGKDLIKNETTT